MSSDRVDWRHTEYKTYFLRMYLTASRLFNEPWFGLLPGPGWTHDMSSVKNELRDCEVIRNRRNRSTVSMYEGHIDYVYGACTLMTGRTRPLWDLAFVLGTGKKQLTSNCPHALPTCLGVILPFRLGFELIGEAFSLTKNDRYPTGTMLNQSTTVV